MEISINNYELNDKVISFTIRNNKITGLTGNTKENIVDTIYLKNHYNGRILIDNTILKRDKINEYKNKISIIKENMLNNYFQTKVYELMYYELTRKEISLKNPKKKIVDSLKIVGLDFSYLNRNINTLSSSERKQLELAVSLLSNPELIIVYEPFNNFDMKNEKKIFSLYQKMKEQYNKTIVFVSNDTSMLHKYTDYTILTKDNEIIIDDETSKVFQDIELLEDNTFEVPKILEITYLAKNKKGIKIDYHKDVRDIIKDIYKHV